MDNRVKLIGTSALMTNPSRINVLFMASEADPLIKVGGLGDVAGSLPRALTSIGTTTGRRSASLDVRLVIPFHPAIKRDRSSLQKVAEYQVGATGGKIPVSVFSLDLDGLLVYLLDGPPIASETGVYSADLAGDGYKYVFFSQAALSLPKRLDWRLDILHANDWHTAAAVYSLALNRLTDPFYRNTASVLTIHNLPYLGAMTSHALSAFDLPPAENTSLPAWANHMALPLGLLTADSIVAASPGYSREIMTEEFGSGLHSFLRAHASKITGILNGLDTRRWDPATDLELVANFSSGNLSPRSINKGYLQSELELDQDSAFPLLAMVTRMDPQKGVDLAIQAIRLLLHESKQEKHPFQVIFLGTGDPVLEQSARSLEQEYPNLIRARITYNERLSRHIFAGADMLLMPSRYEPCGLSQMIAMRYGCIPIARSTGGLSDTIHDPLDHQNRTGFLFKPAKPEALADAIQRALAVLKGPSDNWQAMQVYAMQQDFSWDRSAQEYYQLYSQLLDSK